MTFVSYEGAIAQLGERLICIQEVCGSIPHSSTNSFNTDLKLHRKFARTLLKFYYKK